MSFTLQGAYLALALAVVVSNWGCDAFSIYCKGTQYPYKLEKPACHHHEDSKPVSVPVELSHTCNHHEDSKTVSVPVELSAHACNHHKDSKTVLVPAQQQPAAPAVNAVYTVQPSNMIVGPVVPVQQQSGYMMASPYNIVQQSPPVVTNLAVQPINTIAAAPSVPQIPEVYKKAPTLPESAYVVCQIHNTHDCICKKK